MELLDFSELKYLVVKLEVSTSYSEDTSNVLLPLLGDDASRRPVVDDARLSRVQRQTVSAAVYDSRAQLRLFV